MDFIFLWLVTFVLGFWIFKKFNQWKDLPPGPWGLPIVGYLPFLNANQPHLSLTKLSKTYGPIYGLSMGSVYTVVLSDHKLIRDAFAKDVLSGRAPLYLTQIMNGNGIICSEGSLWKDQRKLISAWLKSFGVSKHGSTREKLEQRISAYTKNLIHEIENSANYSIDLTANINDSLGNAVNDIIFGFKFPVGDKTYKWLKNIQEEGCHELGVSGFLNFLPFLRFLMPSVQNTMHVIKRGQAQTHRLYASVIARRRRLLGLAVPEGAKYALHENIFDEHPDGHIKCISYSKMNPSKNEDHYFDPEVLIPTEGECILDNFLMEQKRRFENKDANAKYTRDEQLVYLLADLFGAGLDTTSVTLAWFFLYMALYPQEQELVRKEILSVYPEEGAVDYSRLPYLMATICEAQRIRSIVPVGIPHGALEDTYLGTFKIPKGSMVVPLQWALHMDPEVWEDPEEFRPMRFMASDGNLLKPKEFIPFQTGKRMCPGDELSRMLACNFAVAVLRRRKITLASEPPTSEELQGAVGVTLTPPRVRYNCELLS